VITIHVNFYQRICLWNLAGGAQVGNLRDAAPYLRMVEKFRPNDQEMLETEFRLEQGTGFLWKPPSFGYGDRAIELESDEQEKLVLALESQPQIKVSDAAWQIELLKQLKPAAREAEAVVA